MQLTINWIRTYHYSHDCAAYFRENDEIKHLCYRGHTKYGSEAYNIWDNQPYLISKRCPYCEELLENHPELRSRNRCTSRACSGHRYAATTPRGHGAGLCQYGAWALGENS
jgi:hypothetical protein